MHTLRLRALPHQRWAFALEHTAVRLLRQRGHTPASAPGKASGTQTVRRVTGTQNYTDLFPSAQIRYAVDDNSNLRFAVTRGIARANYSDLAPHVSGMVCSTCALKFNNLSVGNPDLKPQHAWNVDLLGERYFGASGVFSAGVFYKQITDFIYKRQFIYQGPATEFDGYYATEPANGGDAHLIGGEFDFSRPLDFIPGVPRETRLRRELDAGLLASGDLQGHGDDRRDAREPGRFAMHGCRVSRTALATSR